MKSSLKFGAMIVACAACAAPAVAGTYKAITVDGDFTDWAGVPIVITDDAADASPIDVATVQIANDASNLYVRINYATPVNPNAGPSIFLAFDTDSNPATGYDIRGAGILGSEAGFQNDFPFDQRAGFNSGTVSAGAGISPYNTLTSSQEYSIARNITYGADGTSVFGNSFRVLVYSDGSASNEITPVGSYTFALVPEPVSLGAALAAGAVFIRRRRV
jgi:hypothetical protein